MAALDFRPLDGPLEAGEARRRRRSLLGGRPLVAEFSLLQWTALPFLGFAWLLAVPSVVILVVTSTEWLLTRGPTPDYQLGVPIFAAGSAVVLAALVLLTRAAILPPRWGRWVRMQRFAEANGLVFLRRATGADLPEGVAAAPEGVGLVSEAFVDPETGVVVGHAGEGIGRQAFVLVRRDAPEAPEELAPGEEPLRGFDLVETRDGLLALRHRPVGRSSASIRRLFATADAVRRRDEAAIR